MKYLIYTLCCGFLSHAPVHGQGHTVRGSVQHADGGYLYLASYLEDRFEVVDSTLSSGGMFYFVLPAERPPGVYRLIYDEEYNGIRTENRFVEFIFNGEDLEIFVSTRSGKPVPDFGQSTENRVYQRFLAYELAYEAELVELYRKLPETGDGDPRHRDAVRRYDSLQVARTGFMDSLAGVHPDLYATRIIRAFRSPFLPGSLSHMQRIDTLKQCFFHLAAIDDPALLHAPVYTYKIIDYLSLYGADRTRSGDRAEGYKEAVDHIMVHVSSDPELRSFVVEYLMEGFELLGMNEVSVYIADTYLDQSCLSDAKALVEARKEGYRRMEPGMKAPDFVVRDREGITHGLSEMEDPYVLVMFWASTCIHCRDLLPELAEWYREENEANLEVVAISVDTSAAPYESCLAEFDPGWINTRDPLGWLGKTPAAYQVYLTPTLYLLDSDRTILSKPSGLRQFRRAVRDLE